MSKATKASSTAREPATDRVSAEAAAVASGSLSGLSAHAAGLGGPHARANAASASAALACAGVAGAERPADQRWLRCAVQAEGECYDHGTREWPPVGRVPRGRFVPRVPSPAAAPPTTPAATATAPNTESTRSVESVGAASAAESW